MLSKNDVIAIILLAAKAAAEDPLALLFEGNIAVAVKKRLLEVGCALREGSPRTNEDWILEKNTEALTAKLVARIAGGDTKPDVRVEKPVKMTLELKVFGEVGSKDSFNKGEIFKADGKPKNENSILWDLRSVENGSADAAIIACGARQYDTARGSAWDRRGRRSELTLEELLPPRCELEHDLKTFPIRTWRGIDWVVQGVSGCVPTITETARDGTPRRPPESRVFIAIRRHQSDARVE